MTPKLECRRHHVAVFLSHFFMFGLPQRATALWLAVAVSSSAVLLAAGVAAAGQLRWAPVAVLFAVACAIAESFQISLQTSRPGDHVKFSLSGAVILASALTLPLPWSLLAIGLGIAIGNRPVWFKRFYNVGLDVLSAAGAGLIWHFASANTNLYDLAALPWTVAAVLAYFALSSGLTSGIVALASRMPFRTIYLRTNRNTWHIYLGMLFLGVLIAILWNLSAWTVALAAIPLTAVYFALRNTVGLETETIGALFNLADILDARDPYTHGHSLRVGEYAEKLALSMGLSSDEAHLIFLAGRLHDIGKCAIRNEVLLKPSALDEAERAHMCIHPEVGASMLASFSLFGDCAKYVRGHHERWDGAGYPDQLEGETIPLGARIIAVVDSFDAMTTTRPYRKALPRAEAYRRLVEGAGTQWDPRIIASFLKQLDTNPPGVTEPLPLPATELRLAA
jgi:putative nucleotidyltransferase with HDIG domain